ncbi:transmembrane and coiled-coil domain containing proteins 4 [Coccidioides immitis RMSCC 3703]|uniref:Transmembrane and coiled-coil domain containing proteins 4 n=1 Tax=Coccidioides immitis RMSCC 3703 TaxID=454286 RepID=A0A0J8TKI8_COCIT|nr:transmembrane and coiled-coil domain containing proteins 4 [Coccidioides immitis RMSCC 3703]
MDISWMQICRFEKRVVDALEMQEERNKETWDEAEHMEKRRKEALKRRYMIMGLATVGGGLVIGLSAGLLAPVIGAGLAAGFTTIGVSGTGAFLGGVGGTALITSGATLTGSTIGIRASNRRTGAVKTFEYRPLHNNKRLNLIVTAAGWMTGKVDDVRLPYSTVDPVMGDIYSILWEPEMLQSMGATINILATEALTQGLQQVLGSTILTALMASLQLPIVLTKLSYLIDNPWNVSLARANSSGLILADSLIDRNLGNLANKRAYGIVQNVYLFGSPVVANKDEYLKARSVVSGRFVNGYASNDWILGYLFRATSGGIMRVAGLAPVEGIPGIENFDATKFVNGHMAYRAAMPRLLREVGWEVESDEFTEIEDPDPDSHQERQRELIREIQEARKQAEEKPDKKKFGFFKRGKLAEKKGWETYDVDQGDRSPTNSCDGNADPGGTVLFDIDAIRAELATSQQMQDSKISNPYQIYLPMETHSTSHGAKKKSK